MLQISAEEGKLVCAKQQVGEFPNDRENVLLGRTEGHT